jgi:hypothetical protein
MRSLNGAASNFASVDNSAAGYIEDFTGHASSGGYSETAGTLILHAGGTVAEVQLHTLADERPASDVCTVYGTAVPAS